MFIDKYAYLALVGPFLTAWLLLYSLATPRTKSYQLKMSLIAMPTGPVIETLYFADYWRRPQSILSVDIGPASILLEDVLFAFAVTGICCACYEVLWRKTHVYAKACPARKVMIIRMLFCGLAYGGIWAITHFAHLNSVLSTAAFLFSSTFLILLFRRDLLPAALFTSLFFALTIFVIYSIGFLIVSNLETILKDWWMLYDDPILGWRIMKIPAIEIIWAATYGFACPVMCSTLLGFRYEPAKIS